MNKPCATGRIVRWFVTLLEFDFTIAIKPGRSHQRANHLSRITNGEAPTCVDDDLPDATLFQIDIAPRWAEPILEVLSVTAEWAPKDAQTTLNQLRESDRYTIISGQLYRQGSDNVLKLCVEPEDHREIMEDAHISLGGIHEAEWKTTQRILLNGYWWPTLESDVVQFVANCAKCSQETLVSFATLYSIMPTPQTGLHTW